MIKRNNKGQFIKGNKNRLGKKISNETRKKLSASLMGRSVWNKGLSGYKTKPCSEERKRKIGLANAITAKGKKQSIESRMKKSIALRGSKNHQWQGGITPVNLKIRRGIEYRLWREAVFARDNFTCQITGVRGGKLRAHHIQNFSQFPELRFAIDNGITLSKEIHDEFHNKYGRQNNTKKQLVDFSSMGQQQQLTPQQAQPQAAQTAPVAQ